MLARDTNNGRTNLTQGDFKEISLKRPDQQIFFSSVSTAALGLSQLLPARFTEHQLTLISI